MRVNLASRPLANFENKALRGTMDQCTRGGASFVFSRSTVGAPKGCDTPYANRLIPSWLKIYLRYGSQRSSVATSINRR